MLIVFYTKTSAVGRLVSKRNDLSWPIRRLLQTSEGEILMERSKKRKIDTEWVSQSYRDKKVEYKKEIILRLLLMRKKKDRAQWGKLGVKIKGFFFFEKDI